MTIYWKDDPPRFLPQVVTKASSQTVARMKKNGDRDEESKQRKRNKWEDDW